jgi:hypothetical protein
MTYDFIEKVIFTLDKNSLRLLVREAISYTPNLPSPFEKLEKLMVVEESHISLCQFYIVMSIISCKAYRDKLQASKNKLDPVKFKCFQLHFPAILERLGISTTYEGTKTLVYDNFVHTLLHLSESYSMCIYDDWMLVRNK